jgi:hypothetical protein
MIHTEMFWGRSKARITGECVFWKTMPTADSGEMPHPGAITAITFNKENIKTLIKSCEEASWHYELP